MTLGGGVVTMVTGKHSWRAVGQLGSQVISTGHGRPSPVGRLPRKWGQAAGALFPGQFFLPLMASRLWLVTRLVPTFLPCSEKSRQHGPPWSFISFYTTNAKVTSLEGTESSPLLQERGKIPEIEHHPWGSGGCVLG